MMRYQRLISPDCLPLNSGRKSSKDDDGESSGRIPSYSPFFVDKAPRPRPPINRDHPFSYFAAASASASASASTLPENPLHPVAVSGDVSGICAGGGDGLLQWGHRKRSRGSRSESRPACDDSGHSRPVIKIQRRAAAATATVAMPPPGGLYTRVSNLRPTTPIRDATAHVSRTVDERSNGHARSERRSPASSPLERGHHISKAAAAAGSLQNGCAMESVTSSDPSKPASDQEIAGAQAAEKLSLNHFEWPRIYISLSRKEKEDDFLAMKGTKLPQRPKKRAKNVDKTLQYCFPGMWLSDLTRGRYEVREKKCVKKKRRGGLKGLESMDSDSE